MGKKCLKCGYERQPSDIAPDYECPKCGAIYAKVEAHKQKKESDFKELKSEKKTSIGSENRFIRFIRNHRILSGVIVVLFLIICIAYVGEYYMMSSFEGKVEHFRSNLSMENKEEFEESLKNIMDIITTATNRVNHFGHISVDTIRFHVISTIDECRRFTTLMKKTSDGQAVLYDYYVKRTIYTLNKNLKVTVHGVKNDKARKIIAMILAMRGDADLLKGRPGVEVKITFPKAEFVDDFVSRKIIKFMDENHIKTFVRRADDKDYAIYPWRGCPIAKLRPIKNSSNFELLYWNIFQRKWKKIDDHGGTILPLDEALIYIKQHDFFWN